MQVFKFGGASVKNARAIKNVASIIEKYKNEQLVIVISAMGKTTNHLEKIWKSYLDMDMEGLQTLYKQLKEDHYGVIEQLCRDVPAAKANVDAIFDRLIKLFAKMPVKNQDYLYDQIVAVGEMLSTTIVSHYLNEQNIANEWVNVKRCIKTDNNYREAIINWDLTNVNIKKVVNNLSQSIMVTQGFLGATSENFTTTLGREGSDYTAAVFANCLQADKLTIWKDVPGILNGDPRLMEETKKIEHLSYQQANEMTYFGAKVIHPKTMGPLQSAKVPLEVRSFIDSQQAGTLITTGMVAESDLPPVIIVKDQQAYLNISRQDMQPLTERDLCVIYNAFANHYLVANLASRSAFTLRVATDNQSFKIDPIFEELSKEYTLDKLEEGLETLTFKYYNDAFVKKNLKGRKIILEERSNDLLKLLVSN